MKAEHSILSELPWMELGLPSLLSAATGSLAASFESGPLLSFSAALSAGLAAAFVMFRSRRSKKIGSGGSALLETTVPITIADSNPDAVLFFNDSGKIRYANPVARDLFFEGKSPADQNFLQLVGSAPLPLREALLGESDRLFNIEIEGQRETFHVSRRTFMLEGELHTLLIVKQLTREISRREVEVLKRVIRVISHEVNNSLAPVSSLVHSARKITRGSESAPKLERVFDTIEERTRHLASFLEGYSNLARLPEPRPRRIEWDGFLRHIGELYPGVRLPQAPLDPGFFDPVQIEQVLINLFKNAIEAGSPEADMELHLRVDANGEAELKIEDRGPGFSEEALRSALLPLYTTKERGSGMGLALCREIVEAHGGSMGLGNAERGGGLVSVRLPGRRKDDRGALTRSRLTLTQS
jgi:nitrogen fixation/metabolism regulation signal transduction histidine kinase